MLLLVAPVELDDFPFKVAFGIANHDWQRTLLDGFMLTCKAPLAAHWQVPSLAQLLGVVLLKRVGRLREEEEAG